MVTLLTRCLLYEVSGHGVKWIGQSSSHTQAPNKGWASGRTKVIGALMDVSQRGNEAV